MSATVRRITAKDKGTRHLALVIDGPPKIVELTVDLHENPIDVPGAEIASPQPTLGEATSEHGAKAVPPIPHRLVKGLGPGASSRFSTFLKRKG